MAWILELCHIGISLSLYDIIVQSGTVYPKKIFINTNPFLSEKVKKSSSNAYNRYNDIKYFPHGDFSYANRLEQKPSHSCHRPRQ